LSLWVYAQNSDAVSSAALRAAVILAEPQAIYDITIATGLALIGTKKIPEVLNFISIDEFRSDQTVEIKRGLYIAGALLLVIGALLVARLFYELNNLENRREFITKQIREVFVQTLPHTGPGNKAPGAARSVHPKTSGRIDTPHATDSKVRSTPELLFGASNQEKNRPARKKTRSERGYGESNNSLSPIYFCQITLPHAGLSSCFSLLLVLTRFSLIVNFFMSNPPKGGDIDEQGRSC